MMIMITLYYIQDKEVKYPKAHSGMIFNDEHSPKNYMMNSWAKGLYDISKFEVKSFEIDEKCKCDNYMQTTMVIIFTNDVGNIEFVCANNLIGIYDLLSNIPFGTDIATQTGGKYQMMTIHHFNEHYKIIPLGKN